MNAPVADSSSSHRFNWNWRLKELDRVQKNGRTVFSCFSCGGGSTMGYKLAGYSVIGNVEIDPEMNEVYKRNLKPKFNYEMDIRDFNALGKWEPALMGCDILDGSPPCSVFSMAGDREKGWNIEKRFKEGQKKQRLDDLFFHFIRTAEILRPKIVVAENVKGLLVGKSRGFVVEIAEKFREIGYQFQTFLLNSATMGVPQRRERVFFIAHRNDLAFPKLKLDFSERPITFKEVRSPFGTGIPFQKEAMKAVVACRRYGDRHVAHTSERVRNLVSMFADTYSYDERVAPTLAASGVSVRFVDGLKYSVSDTINVQTFPQDYDFGRSDVRFVCGMSVPPVMMANISSEIYEQWLKGME